MDSKTQQQLQSRIEEFAKDVTNILQRAVHLAMKDALPRGGKGKVVGSRGARRAARSVTPEALLKEVAREGDRRMEQIADALGAKSRTLLPVMKKLIAEKKVKTTGQARGTKYRAA